MLDFVAIDFETANKFPNSAISLAAVTIEDNKLTKKAYSLIKPPFMKFDPECIEIHKIQPNEVLDKPNFETLWPNIYNNHLKGKIVIAHNANFDIKVLRATLDHYNLNWPDFRYACTVKIARKVWPDLYNHRLNTIAEFLGIKFQHHQALDDALTCAKVAMAAAQVVGANSMDELMAKCGLAYEPFIQNKEQVEMSLF